MDVRIERDSMGEVEVPADALWRAQTQRAVENFPISGSRLEAEHVQALALVKAAAATVNGRLKRKPGEPLARAEGAGGFRLQAEVVSPQY